MNNEDRNIDLIERIASIRELAEAAPDSALKDAVLLECLRATDYEAWLSREVA